MSVVEHERTQISRRTLVKVGANALWALPAIQVVSASPAFATCHSGTATSAQLSFSASAEWIQQGNTGTYYLRVTFVVCNSDCDEAFGNISATVTSKQGFKLKEHSTSNQKENPGTTWQSTGGNGTSTLTYTSAYSALPNACTPIPHGIQFWDDDTADKKFTGKLQVTISSGSLSSTITIDVPA